MHAQHMHTPACRMLCKVYSFRPYTEQLPPGGDSLKATLEKCVAAAVPKWFRVLDAKLLPEVNVRIII